jgi:hypothetical protein
MSQPVGPLIDIAAQRAFDPHLSGTSRALVRDLYSRIQQFVNAAFDSNIVVQAMPTMPQLQVYNFERIAAANNILRIKSVRQDTRDLSRIDFNRLKLIDTKWFSRTGAAFQTYAVLGRRILIVHPQMPIAGSVNVVYTQQLPILNAESDKVGLPDDEIPLLTRMVEAVLLLKQRDLDALTPLLESITAEIQAIRQAAVEAA